MAVCVVCGVALPAGSRADRLTCGDRCRKRRSSRNARSFRPASMLTAAEARERLAELAPERWGPPPSPADSGSRLPEPVRARDPLEGLPEDDPLYAMLAEDRAALERLRDQLAAT